jgi:hypothetical protein
MTISTPGRYGALQEGFSIELPDSGYVVLTGSNNSGKSAILQLAFNQLFTEEPFGSGRIALLLPERTYVQTSTETGGRTLEAYNQELRDQLAGAILGYDGPKGPSANELPRLLLNHSDLLPQFERLNRYLVRLGLPNISLKGSQQVHFENIAVQFQGSGLRSLLAILTVLSDHGLRVILIDEPELSLEPRLQKDLRDLLIEEANDRLVAISSHSHLFLHRQEPSRNYIVRNNASIVAVSQVPDDRALYDLTFQLLGSNTEDLFFPGNYLIVEGASDQLICAKAIELLGIQAGKVKVMAAGGMSKVGTDLAAVENSLKPLVMADSPYSGRVVALIDKPKPREQSGKE